MLGHVMIDGTTRGRVRVIRVCGSRCRRRRRRRGRRVCVENV